MSWAELLMGMFLPPRLPDNSKQALKSGSKSRLRRLARASARVTAARRRHIAWIRRRIRDGGYHVPAKLIAAAMLNEFHSAASPGS